MDHKIAFLLVLNVFLRICNGYLHFDWEPSKPAFDKSIYEDALDPELCEAQLAYLNNNTLLSMQFLESGMRLPRGILVGNTRDLGNYIQCLGINQNVEDINIEGKYCSINVPFNQSLQLPQLPGIPDRPDWIPEWIDQLPKWIERVPEWVDFDPRKLKMDQSTLNSLEKYEYLRTSMQVINGNHKNSEESQLLAFTLAVCVPKPCTSKEGIDGLFFNLTAFGFQYTENYCRLNNDKPWVPADYIAIVVFFLLGLITVISTTYDIWHTHVIKSDPKSIKTLHRSFSLYTNSRRLLTFTKSPGALECVDGIRAISMIWVILGHTFSTFPEVVNLLDTLTWMTSLESIWVTAAPISVDTFFMISGMLLVYTTAGKLTGGKLLRSLHLFYLNRILRMFPLLAAAVLIQASFMHRISDGPSWNDVSIWTENCRNYWWTTLLYVQNFLNPENMCLPHAWYLAIDMQIHILVPLVLYWVLSGNNKVAWTAIVTTLLAVLVASTAYIFIMEFPGSVIATARRPELMNYMVYYYLNTLTRASPFLVGMVFGYLLHLWREKTLKLSKVTTVILWGFIPLLTLSVIFSSHPMKNIEWDNQTYDSLVNAFSRPLWAVGVGMIIVACVHGYGGPVDWFLSLQIWKLPSRISYGMYIYHFGIMHVTADSIMQPPFFTVTSTVYRFLSEVLLAFLVSFVMTLFVDAPFSTLFKLMLGGGSKKSEEPSKPKFIKNGQMNLSNSVVSHKANDI